MKRKVTSLVLALLMLSLVLVACGNRAVISLKITEGLATQYELNSTPDFSKVKGTATYNDETTVDVTADDLTFSELDTKTPGKKNLTITYDGFSITIEVEVKGATLGGNNGGGNNGGDNGGDNGGNGGDNGGDNGGNGGGLPEGYDIMGVNLPTSLAAFETNAQRFKDKQATYVVGDDNPFTFRLLLMILDPDDKPVTNITSYVSTSTVHLVEGSTNTLVDTTYVTIDETNNTFDFTDAAIDKTFRITTRPLYNVDSIEEECTRSWTVTVKDGYNVTNAKELNLMTNDPIEMHERYKTQEERLLPENKQNAIAKAFVDQQFGTGYYATYGGDALKGLIFHDNISPTIYDIPSDYVVTSTVDGTLGFDDAFSVYDHYSKGAFGIYGNYFTLNTSSLPLMSNDPAIVGDQVSSDSDVFGIEGDAWKNLRSFDYKDFPCVVENLAMRDVNANENIPENSPKRMRGLNGFDLIYLDMTMKNTIIEAYTISVVPSNCSSRLNLEQCIFNNAWQNHIFVWSHNRPMCATAVNDDDPIYNTPHWDNLTPIEINITDSVVTKCGGPAILTQKDGCGGAHNENAGVIVTVDTASELWSYVTGEEAWFVAYNKVQDATTLKSLDGAFLGNAAGYGEYGYQASASILTTQEGTGTTQFMNLVFVSVGGGDCKYIVRAGNTSDALLDDSNETVKNHVTNNPNNPLFRTTEGGMAQFNANANYQMVDANGGMIMPTEEYAGPVFKGDHIALYTFGMSIVMGYYH